MKMPAPPYHKIGSIWLPSGTEFYVWSNYAIAVPPNWPRPAVCKSAAPQLPDAYWAEIVGLFDRAGLVPDGYYLHWVGRQTEIEHVCTCFGILEPSEGA